MMTTWNDGDRRAALATTAAILALLPLPLAYWATAGDDFRMWYDALPKASIAPPAWLFGVVWTPLFVMTAIALFLSWTRTDPDDRPFLERAGFWGILVLNAIWMPVFAATRSTELGFWLILADLVCVLVVLFHVKDRLPIVSGLLTPSAVWLLYATGVQLSAVYGAGL